MVFQWVKQKELGLIDRLLANFLGFAQENTVCIRIGITISKNYADQN